MNIIKSKLRELSNRLFFDYALSASGSKELTLAQRILFGEESFYKLDDTFLYKFPNEVESNFYDLNLEEGRETRIETFESGDNVYVGLLGDNLSLEEALDHTTKLDPGNRLKVKNIYVARPVAQDSNGYEIINSKLKHGVVGIWYEIEKEDYQKILDDRMIGQNNLHRALCKELGYQPIMFYPAFSLQLNKFAQVSRNPETGVNVQSYKN
jgi:hypothetical protein